MKRRFDEKPLQWKGASMKRRFNEKVLRWKGASMQRCFNEKVLQWKAASPDQWSIVYANAGPLLKLPLLFAFTSTQPLWLPWLMICRPPKSNDIRGAARKPAGENAEVARDRFSTLGQTVLLQREPVWCLRKRPCLELKVWDCWCRCELKFGVDSPIECHFKQGILTEGER